MHELNQLISSSTEPGRFITFFLGVVEPHTARLTYVNAGHNPPILVRAGGRLERLADGGLLLGAFPEAEYEAGGTTLEPGDALVLYTDGVVEARRAGDDAYFEEERLEALLGQGLGGLPAATIRDRIVGAVSEFAAGAEQADDITVVVLRYLGPGPTARTPATPATPATLPDAAGA
jgi:sigma-B regulation protein RsbU (phosphoserine phosphatase)